MAERSKYRSLNPALIIKSLETLVRRIEERFPRAGLAIVSRDLVDFAKETTDRSHKSKRSNIWLKLLIWAAILAGVALLAVAADVIFTRTKANDDLFGTLQGIHAGFNIVVLWAQPCFLSPRLKCG